MSPLKKTLVFNFSWTLILILGLMAIDLALEPTDFALITGVLPSILIELSLGIHGDIVNVIGTFISILILMLPYSLFKFKNIQSNWFYVVTSLYSFINSFLGLIVIAAPHV